MPAASPPLSAAGRAPSSLSGYRSHRPPSAATPVYSRPRLMAPLRRLPPSLCAALGTQAFLRALLAIVLRHAGPLPTTVSSLSAASSAGTLARDASHRAASS